MPRLKTFSKGKPFNFVTHFQDGQLGMHRSNYRQSILAMRSIVTDPRNSFVEIWTQESLFPIYYEDNKIYFKNYRKAFTLCGKDSLPTMLYELDRVKMLDHLCFTAPINKTMNPPSDYKPFFMVLTRDNWLFRYNNVTGELLQKIYLNNPSTGYKYVNLNWECQGETLHLQSTYFTKSRRKCPEIVQAVAIFSIFPLKFIAKFEIETRVFGKDVKSANLSEGLLIIGAGTGARKVVRIYRLDDVLSPENTLCHCNIGEDCSRQHSDVGMHPTGLPVTIHMKKAPPVIFELFSSDQSAKFGGYPFHFICTPPNTSGVFSVVNLKTRAEIHKFDLQNITNLEDDCWFHEDDSGRVLYSSAHKVEFFKINPNQGALEKLFELSTESGTTPASLEVLNNLRRDGLRTITARKVYSLLERSLLDVDYENELELCSILALDKDSPKRGIIRVFDNDTGKAMMNYSLPHRVHEDSEYSLIMDLDTFIVIEKDDKRSRVTLYRLKRDDE